MSTKSVDIYPFSFSLSLFRLQYHRPQNVIPCPSQSNSIRTTKSIKYPPFLHQKWINKCQSILGAAKPTRVISRELVQCLPVTLVQLQPLFALNLNSIKASLAPSEYPKSLGKRWEIQNLIWAHS